MNMYILFFKLKKCLERDNRYNMFIADFGHIKTNVKCNLFKQYCCSYYGAPLWDLQSKSVGTICTVWRKALRKLWGQHRLHTVML